MRRLDRGPSRRERRAATKGIPSGRRSTRKVETTMRAATAAFKAATGEPAP